MGEVVPITEKKEELDAEVRGWKQSVLEVMQEKEEAWRESGQQFAWIDRHRRRAKRRTASTAPQVVPQGGYRPSARVTINTPLLWL